MNNRRKLIVALGASALASPLVALGQPASKIYRVGILATFPNHWQVDGLKQVLRDLGYVEGKTFLFEIRSADGKYDRLPALAVEFVQRNVDVILAAGGTPAALAAKGATPTIPIVFTGVADPVRQGLVASLARPGANVTGISNQYRETSAKTLELLNEIVPSAKHVAILSNPTNASLPLVIQEVRAAARVLQLETSIVQARSPDDFDNAFADVARLRAGGLILLSDSMLNSHFGRLASLAAQQRLPAIGGAHFFPESGGLISYGANRAEYAQRSAVLVDKILKGTKPRDLPIEQATKFELVVNMKAAKALGITFPPTVMMRADQVIQ